MNVTAVATFAHPDFSGGAERVVAEVCRRLAARGHAVRLVTGGTPAMAHDEERDGVVVARYPLDRSSTTAFWRSVRRGVRARLAEGEAPDVLHVHQIASALPAVDAGLDCPVVASFYAPYSEEYLARRREGRDAGDVGWRARAAAAVLRRIDRRVLARCDRIVVLSAFSAEQVASLAPRARPIVAPAGVDLERFAPGASSLRASTGLTDDVPIVLSVRRLEPRMGLVDLLDAAARLVARGVALRVVIVGDGPARAELEARAARDDLAGHVVFTGRIDDDALADAYRGADVFALPTRSLEGFGMATAEALASGLPVVATDVGATPEVLAGLDGSALVPPQRPDRLADALAPLLTDAEARARSARAARAHAETTLDWDTHVDALEAAFVAAEGAR